jgi:hypothetical protein
MPAAVPASTCRQVVYNETLTMRQEPCFGSAAIVIGNTLVELVRGDTFEYINTDSKQTSMCRSGAASDPPGRMLCWVQGSFKGVNGWLPVARGTFKDAFCSADPETAQSFVAESCGESGLACNLQCLAPVSALHWCCFLACEHTGCHDASHHLDARCEIALTPCVRTWSLDAYPLVLTIPGLCRVLA